MKTNQFTHMKQIRTKIQKCSDFDHIQQVAYSTYHDALTQICFSCQTVRTNLENPVENSSTTTEGDNQ